MTFVIAYNFRIMIHPYLLHKYTLVRIIFGWQFEIKGLLKSSPLCIELHNLYINKENDVLKYYFPCLDFLKSRTTR